MKIIIALPSAPGPLLSASTGACAFQVGVGPSAPADGGAPLCKLLVIASTGGALSWPLSRALGAIACSPSRIPCGMVGVPLGGANRPLEAGPIEEGVKPIGIMPSALPPAGGAKLKVAALGPLPLLAGAVKKKLVGRTPIGALLVLRPMATEGATLRIEAAELLVKLGATSV